MEWVELDLKRSDAVFRYDVLERVKRYCDAWDVRFMGFALGREGVALLEGEPDRVAGVVSGVRRGTARRWGSASMGTVRRRVVYDPRQALLALHGGGHGCPLADPWTSHRDLLGFRKASFYDASVWDERIDPRWVHVRCGGAAMPVPMAPRTPHPRRETARHRVDLCLRVSAAVLGVLPGDRRGTRLFSHLGRHAGIRQVDLAEAVLLTPRRIRQLQRAPEPLVGIAARSLSDRRLNRVP